LDINAVWEQDSQKVYLSFGCDSLALHPMPEINDTSLGQCLDHLGFMVESIARIQELEQEFRALGLKIIRPCKLHRHGSASFHCADLDQIVIQMIYEPRLSSQRVE
jgi:hypothetical protein